METGLEEPPSLLIAEFLDSYLLGGIILILLLIFSALVSGSEVAFFSLTNDNITKLQKSNLPSERKMVKLLKNPRVLLATILILNNFINIAFVTLSTFLSWSIFGTWNLEGVIVASLTLIVTFMIVFFGELVPKVYANQNNVQFAKFTAPIIIIFEAIFRPFSWMLINLSGVIEKRFKNNGYEISVDELHQALELASHETDSEEEKEILKGIVNFGTLTVKQVMRTRVDITAFDMDFDFHELLDKVKKSGFSRIPVFDDTIDNIKGILYIKDLLPFIDKDEYFKWQKYIRVGYFVPENKKIDLLLKDFQTKRVHMAIVVDEYGGTSGLITLEDIIEEIVGEISDEFDENQTEYKKLSENSYVFEGRTSLNDFCKITGQETNVFDEIKGESESLGGLILEINNKLPHIGDKITIDNFVFTAEAVDHKRIKKVRVLIMDNSDK